MAEPRGRACVGTSGGSPWSRSHVRHERLGRDAHRRSRTDRGPGGEARTCYILDVQTHRGKQAKGAGTILLVPTPQTCGPLLHLARLVFACPKPLSRIPSALCRQATLEV